jgi:hypothetical protein
VETHYEKQSQHTLNSGAKVMTSPETFRAFATACAPSAQEIRRSILRKILLQLDNERLHHARQNGSEFTPNSSQR